LTQIIIGGDLVPTESNMDLFIKGEAEILLGKDIFRIWNSVDARIFNLETPLVDIRTPIIKYGSALSASLAEIKGIKALNPSLISLANNHILDQGVQGLKLTENILMQNGIPFVGIGDNLTEACKPYIFNFDKLRIGVYSCAEHEFTIATANTPGANPFDSLESLDHIKNLKSVCDYVIVLYHGGKEHYRYPSPNLQKVCRKMVQKGADFVVCQHSHCIGCYENYQNSTIVYGQGNFIFDRKENEFWNTGLLLKLIFDNDIKVEYIPIVKKVECIRLANEETAEKILSDFEDRSNMIKKDGFVKDNYAKFAEKSLLYYLKGISKQGKLTRLIDRKLLNDIIIKKKFGTNQLLALRNCIECESHREMILTGIDLRINERK